MGTEGAAGGDNGTDKVAGVEERGQNGTFLGVGKLANQTRAGYDGVGKTETNDGAGNDVRGGWIILAWFREVVVAAVAGFSSGGHTVL